MMKLSQYELVSKIEEVQKLVAAAKETISNRLTNGYYNRICEMAKRNQILAFLKSDQDMYGEQAYSLLASTWDSGVLSRLFDQGGDVTSSDLDASIRILRHLLNGGVYYPCEADSYEIRHGVGVLKKQPLTVSSWQVIEASGTNRNNWRVYWHDNIAILAAVQQIESELEKTHRLLKEKDLSASRREASALRRQEQSSTTESATNVYPEWLWFYWGEEDIEASRSIRDTQLGSSRADQRFDPVDNDQAQARSIASFSAINTDDSISASTNNSSSYSGSSSYESGGSSDSGGGGGD